MSNYNQDFKMETFLQFFTVSILLFSNIVSPDPYFDQCSPALCSDKTHGMERCSCRQDCYLYNECCSDMINNTSTDHRHPYPSTYYSCRDVQGDYYYQFDHCPPNHDVTEYVSNCEHPNSNDQLHNIPAFGKTSKKLYRNLYCALCHGEEFILWNVLYDCDVGLNINLENLSNYVKDGICRPEVIPPSIDLEQHLCSCTQYISKCQEDYNNTEQRVACESEPMALARVRFKVFRNKHCARCNGFEEIDCYREKEFRSRARSGRVKPLTFLFNYHTNNIEMTSEGLPTNKQFPSCPKHAVYDMITRQCRQVIYHPSLNCTTTRLNESEYHITSDGLLYLNDTQHLLNQSEFSLDSEGVSICVKNGTNVIAKYSIAERYITLVGLMISIPALAITIIIYLCIPQLRTLPGKLLISLLSALFLSELLFLISSQVTKFTVMCTSLAVVMHYSLLATFFWMNVMSFDAWYTFSGLTQLRSIGKSNKRLVLYSLYAWICPLVIVTISLIFEYIPGNHGLSPEYGKGDCWITNGKSLLWLFAIPVMIILCFNIIAFILTARGLYLASKHSSKYLSKDNKKQFFIYIKLCFIMGLTWVFAFLYTFTRIEEFSLLFCILNSFIGLFICISFLSTKLVCRSFLQNVQKIKTFPTKESTNISSVHKTLSTDISAKVSLN